MSNNDRYGLNKNLAQMLKGGVIMDVTNVEQAKIAEDAGAVAVMALERVPADIRREGGVARMSDPKMIREIKEAVSIPVMAKARIGHFVEAQILEAIGIDYIDESEVLTPADEENHIYKKAFKIPFVCGARNLGEALRRIGEGASMIRTKGEAGTGNVVEAVRHMRTMQKDMRRVQLAAPEELMHIAKEFGAPYDLIEYVHEHGNLPVVNFAAGGIATPADAALMMQIGVDGVFVGSGIFKSGDPAKRAKAIVEATTFYNDPDKLAKISENLGEAMVGINIDTLAPEQHMAAQEKHIGVLGMQGAVAEHLKMLGELPHVKPFIVRTQQELDEADGLILPGGESTAMTKLLDYFKLRQPLAAKIKQGLPVWGTCAGMILLADRIESAHKDKPILAAMDITVRRNAYGSQLDSFEADVPVPAVKKEGTVPLVFIRAPFVVSAGSDVDILAKVNGNIVAVRQGSMLATAFHPELTDDLSFHRYFADMVQ